MTEWIPMPTLYRELSPKDRRKVREQYVETQEGLCWFCNKPLSGKPPQNVVSKPVNKRLFPPNFFKYPVHLQHDHVSGLTEGAVHNYCNAVLWQYHGR